MALEVLRTKVSHTLESYFIGITERGHAQDIIFIGRMGKQIWAQGPRKED